MGETPHDDSQDYGAGGSTRPSPRQQSPPPAQARPRQPRPSTPSRPASRSAIRVGRHNGTTITIPTRGRLLVPVADHAVRHRRRGDRRQPDLVRFPAHVPNGRRLPPGRAAGPGPSSCPTRATARKPRRQRWMNVTRGDDAALPNGAHSPRAPSSPVTMTTGVAEPDPFPAPAPDPDAAGTGSALSVFNGTQSQRHVEPLRLGPVPHRLRPAGGRLVLSTSRAPNCRSLPFDCRRQRRPQRHHRRQRHSAQPRPHLPGRRRCPARRAGRTEGRPDERRGRWWRASRRRQPDLRRRGCRWHGTAGVGPVDRCIRTRRTTMPADPTRSRRRPRRSPVRPHAVARSTAPTPTATWTLYVVDRFRRATRVTSPVDGAC